MFPGLFASLNWSLVWCRFGGWPSLSGLDVPSYCHYWSVYVGVSWGLLSSCHSIYLWFLLTISKGKILQLYNTADGRAALYYQEVSYNMYPFIKYSATQFLYRYFSWLSLLPSIAWQTMGLIPLCRMLTSVFKVVPHHSLHLSPLA